jgi:methylmalonyl-CoA mutase cobalamin-binding subunit
MSALDRQSILSEQDLPKGKELVAEGRRLAKAIDVGSCPFLTTYDVDSESVYKRRQMADGALMFHAQFGYRSFDKSRRAYAEIYEKVAAEGYRVDRYGICLDWSMGYPAAQRANMPRGTGMILEKPEDFSTLTQGAPVAPHFGDFVIGTPASVENTTASLAAGSTSIGNLGQYFTFSMPRWDDEVGTTAETVKAIAICAAMPVDVLVHSNLDDGFAALFCDMACAMGAVLIERHIVNELIGGQVSHCYGHIYSDPLTRFAFQRALARVTETPGTMVYGNTTSFVSSEVENYANLASYLLVDAFAQHTLPTGHGLNPVPVTEALRIPEINEIVDAHLFANRLANRAESFEALFDQEATDEIAIQLVEGGKTFKERVLQGLDEAGIAIDDPFELLLSIRRIGAKRLEELFGPGKPAEGVLRKRTPVVRATTVAALEAQGDGVVATLSPSDQAIIRGAGFTACVTCTDVHEYGKILVETVLDHLDVNMIDAGVSTDPEDVAERAKAADFVAVSTYCGVALDFVQDLRREMTRIGLEKPIFIGGKLNQVPEDSQTSMPEDVTDNLRELGVRVCLRVEDMLVALVKMAGEKTRD